MTNHWERGEKTKMNNGTNAHLLERQRRDPISYITVSIVQG